MQMQMQQERNREEPSGARKPTIRSTDAVKEGTKEKTLDKSAPRAKTQCKKGVTLKKKKTLWQNRSYIPETFIILYK